MKVNTHGAHFNGQRLDMRKDSMGATTQSGKTPASTARHDTFKVQRQGHQYRAGKDNNPPES
ncbi:hypothetical protein [Cobetia sp. Dlab-2-U]|uniref:hypothetical protein n=1 Tax=Cobetia sp. Dlab-2-U TaxID=2954489 RepID=UPI002097150E|nr:hypothetical protein [Cobetia sp. Dlab-2-U]MCO7234539.1 hypothetical protein [Cobetia sp. Dlab-2-U]